MKKLRIFCSTHEWEELTFTYMDMRANTINLFTSVCPECMKEMLASTQSVVAETAGGMVEGHPTSEINYLQRIRELRQIEANMNLYKREAFVAGMIGCDEDSMPCHCKECEENLNDAKAEATRRYPDANS